MTLRHLREIITLCRSLFPTDFYPPEDASNCPQRPVSIFQMPLPSRPVLEAIPEPRSIGSVRTHFANKIELEHSFLLIITALLYRSSTLFIVCVVKTVVPVYEDLSVSILPSWEAGLNRVEQPQWEIAENGENHTKLALVAAWEVGNPFEGISWDQILNFMTAIFPIFLYCPPASPMIQFWELRAPVYPNTLRLTDSICQLIEACFAN